MSHPDLSRHAITFVGPAAGFFEGAVLGNGGLGAVVCTRPDALVIHFGHNDVWDIRLSERNKDKLLTFPEVLARVQAIPPTVKRLTDDPWYRDYLATVSADYTKPYPRPMPCGTLVLAWDRRLPVEVLGHAVDPSDGTCTVRLLVRGSEIHVRLFADMAADRLWISCHDAAGEPCPAPFVRVALLPDAGTPGEFPRRGAASAADALSFRQVLPALEPEVYDSAAGHANDKAFRLAVRVNGELHTGTRINWHMEREALDELARVTVVPGAFLACVQLDHGPARIMAVAVPDLPLPTPSNWAAARAASRQTWAGFWSRSAVQLEDQTLERMWYRNLYFLRSSLRAGVTCPGLFANWSRNSIGTAWHGDYHMNYNTQQPFWVVFAANQIDLHEPYVRLVNDRLLPLATSHARDYYRLPGAAFPHSVYPVPMTIPPYPTPEWGWEIFETPWTVQSLWWQYRYTGDVNFLRREAFAPMRAATEFMVAFLDRPDATGARWGDGKRHLFPSISPEMNGGLRPGLDRNHDCIVDLALARFLMRAFAEACRALGCEAKESTLLERCARFANELPDYATAIHPVYGEVFLDVAGGEPESVFNTPNLLMPVFPCEEFGLNSSVRIRRIAANTLASQRIEGGNHLVFSALQAARLGLLDLERFKRDVAYNTLPNGTATDKALESGGRYDDYTPFDYMAAMGIWFENFALPAVINESLIQSHDGTIRLFPNWPVSAGAAEFRTLRAVGAFLISARCAAGVVAWVEVLSERGGELRLHNPWPRAQITTASDVTIDDQRLLTIATLPGQVVRVTAEA